MYITIRPAKAFVTVSNFNLETVLNMANNITPLSPSASKTPQVELPSKPKSRKRSAAQKAARGKAGSSAGQAGSSSLSTRVKQATVFTTALLLVSRQMPGASAAPLPTSLARTGGLPGTQPAGLQFAGAQSSVPAEPWKEALMADFSVSNAKKVETESWKEALMAKFGVSNAKEVETEPETKSESSSTMSPGMVRTVTVAAATTATAVIGSLLNGEVERELGSKITEVISQGSKQLIEEAEKMEASGGPFGKSMTLETDFIVELAQATEKNKPTTGMQQGFARLGINLALEKKDDGGLKITPTLQLKTHLISGAAKELPHSAVGELAMYQISSVNIPLEGGDITETRFVGPLLDYNKSPETNNEEANNEPVSTPGGSSTLAVNDSRIEELADMSVGNLSASNDDGPSVFRVEDPTNNEDAAAERTGMIDKAKDAARAALKYIKDNSQLEGGVAIGFRTKTNLTKMAQEGTLPAAMALKLLTNTAPAVAAPGLAYAASSLGGTAGKVGMNVTQVAAQALSLAGTVASAKLALDSDALESIDFQAFAYPYVATTGAKLSSEQEGLAEGEPNTNYSARLPRVRWDALSLNYTTPVWKSGA